MVETPQGTVTFLFTDVEGSTRRWEQYRDDMASAMARHDGIVRASIESHGGAVFTTAGDQFCAAFQTAADAVRSAVEIQRELADQPWGLVSPLMVRMALHTGRAEERDGDYFGPPLNRCARLLAIGHGGQVLTSMTTAGLIEADLGDAVTMTDLGDHQLKDLERPERVFQVEYDGMRAEFPELRSVGDDVDAEHFFAPLSSGGFGNDLGVQQLCLAS